VTFQADIKETNFWLLIGYRTLIVTVIGLTPTIMFLTEETQFALTLSPTRKGSVLQVGFAVKMLNCILVQLRFLKASTTTS